MSKLFRPKGYFRPKTIDEAISLLAEFGARSIAGSTDLLVVSPPEVEYLVDITSLPLNYVRVDVEGIKIGSLTTFRNIETSLHLKKGAYAILVEAARTIGHAHSRNVSTVGGNLCNAVPSADFPPAIIVLDAHAKIRGPTGDRILPIEEFFIGVRKTALKRGELLTEIHVPRQPARTGTAFLKIGRTIEDIALVNVAVRVTLGSEGAFDDVRIALGAVAPTPIRAKKAEVLLKGKKPGDSLIKEAAQVAAEETKPISDHRTSAEYRREVSRILTKRALNLALERVKVEDDCN